MSRHFGSERFKYASVLGAFNKVIFFSKYMITRLVRVTYKIITESHRIFGIKRLRYEEIAEAEDVYRVLPRNLDQDLLRNRGGSYTHIASVGRPSCTKCVLPLQRQEPPRCFKLECLKYVLLSLNQGSRSLHMAQVYS